MSKKKNLTKAKKIRKQLLAASATGLLLVSSAASAGTSLVYAAEKQQPATAEKSTKNVATAAAATASSPQAASNKPVNPSLMNWNLGEILPSLNSPKNNYSGQIPETLRGAIFRLTFSLYRNPGSTLTANDINVTVNGKNVTYKRSQNGDQLNVQVTFQAEGADTNFSVSWPSTGKGGVRKWCTTDFGKYTDIPESGITNRGAINNLLNGIYSTSGVLVSGVTQAKINMVRELILDKIPMDDNYQYASAYWANFLTPFLNKASAEVEQIDQATTVVNSLFDSNQQPKLTNTQEQINAAKTKVNALPESSAKTALLEKVATAQQAFEAVKNEAGKVQLATEAVNALFNGLVPKLTNTQEQIDAAKAKVNALANSDVKTALLARIASAQKVFDASVEAAKQATEQIRNDLNALYFRNNGNIDKTGLSREATQSAFDALQQRIDALSINAPAMNQQKQALQTQLNDMKAMLQEIQLKASSGQVVAQLDSNPKGTYIRTFAGTVPGNATIGKIQITEPKYNSFIYLFNKEYQGGTYQNTVSNLIETTGRKRGKLIITTNEMPLAVNGNIQLSNTVSKEYTFKLNSNGKWELSSSSYDAVQNAVNALFNGETPKPENTQEQIDQAKNQVNNLFDGADKNALLAKITKVQQAFDASTEEAGKTIEQIRKDLNNLYFKSNGNIDKTGLSNEATQSAFDGLQQRINALPNSVSEQKQALQTQLNDMQAMLQEIQLKTASGQLLALIDTNPKRTYIYTPWGIVPGNGVIGKVKVMKGNQYMYNDEFRGGDKIHSVTTSLGQGSEYKLIITTNEAPLTVNSNVKLSNTVSKDYTFNVTDGWKWTLESSSYTTAQNAVNALFNGETPKPENTQEQIDQAKNQVNNLLDGTDKEALLAKIQKAQQALEAGNKEKFTLNPYTLGDEYATGTITGNIKKFQLIVGDKTYEPGFKLVNGKLEVYIGNRVPAGTKEFTLKAFNPAGQQVASQVVQVQDVSLTVDKFSLGDEYMTGSYTGSTTKKFRLTVDDKVYNPGFKLTKGKFEVYVGSKVTGDSKVVKLEALDKLNQTIAQQTVTVEKPQLNMNEYVRDDEYMTGTVEGKGIKKFKLVINGNVNMPGFKLNGNKFEIYIGNKVPANINTVKVVGLDAYGKEIVSQDVTVQAPSLALDEYVRGNEYMKGTFKGGIKKFKLTVDGTVYSPGFKVTDGNRFEVYIGNRITANSKSVTLEALDRSGNVLVTQPVSVAQPELVPNEYTRNAEYLTGSYKGDIRSFKLTVAGKEYKPGFKLKEGNQFEVYIGNKIPAATDKFTIESLSFDGKQLVSVEVPVK